MDDLPELESGKTALLDALESISRSERDGMTLTRIVILAEMEDEERFRRIHTYRGFSDHWDFAGYLMALGARRMAQSEREDGTEDGD